MNEHQNRVELIGTYGGDITHALSAWTSTHRDLTPEKRERIPKLLADLAKNEHHSPFEKSAIHLLVTSDIATHIHIIKHRIGVSVNAESARYKELKDDKFYVPVDWPEEAKTEFEEKVKELYAWYHTKVETLTDHFSRLHAKELPIEVVTPEIKKKARSRAKESARFILPYANQITQDVMFNFRSFAHFLHLRLDPHAQREVRELAQGMLDLIKETGAFEHSLAAFGYK